MRIAALIKAPWLVENLQLVGGGCLFHLAYDESQMSATAHKCLTNGQFQPETPVMIYWLYQESRATLVADGNLAELVKIGNTLRLHIRLLHVRPFATKQEIIWPYHDIDLDVA